MRLKRLPAAILIAMVSLMSLTGCGDYIDEGWEIESIDPEWKAHTLYTGEEATCAFVATYTYANGETSVVAIDPVCLDHYEP
jgi:uncharacterized lipoprotein YehR (DUF1307 family)